MARKINLKPFADDPKDLIDLKKILEENYDQVYSGQPQKASEGDYYIKIIMILNGWEDQPASIKQLLTLLSHGIHFHTEITKGEASKIIKSMSGWRVNPNG